ncbi:hypothetical protein RDWZM_001501 [Blomia tropicalis]|uniref:E3 ubiquitin-protein ligase MARCHF5 n=1 Tax=Blomia tropicalis TaxID=40697 RepID=A0A9Q0RRD4_BLOTA|nr:hypothetical protein RDWZM_001501 [Blomia tropicalis]
MMEVCVIDDGSPTSESSITISLPSIHIQDDVDVVCQCETKSTSEDDCDEMVLTKTESTSSVVASRQCWVCLATDDEDEENTEWTHPCKCSGTAKWVHQNCLQQWVDEKQKYNSTLSVSCTQCNTKYMIVFPSNGKIFYAIDLCDRILYSASPLATITCIVGSIYWSAVCYGAFTILQVFGKERGKCLINEAKTIYLLVGLPAIPVVLIASKMICWENILLKLWQKNEFRFPLFGYIIGKPAEKPPEFVEHNLFCRDAISDPIVICRNFCGALILPTAATLFGELLFGNFNNGLHRAILGGITFTVGKGLIKILLRQNQYVRQTHRKILNFYGDK